MTYWRILERTESNEELLTRELVAPNRSVVWLSRSQSDPGSDVEELPDVDIACARSGESVQIVQIVRRAGYYLSYIYFFYQYALFSCSCSVCSECIAKIRYPRKLYRGRLSLRSVVAQW